MEEVESRIEIEDQHQAAQSNSVFKKTINFLSIKIFRKH